MQLSEGALDTFACDFSCRCGDDAGATSYEELCPEEDLEVRHGLRDRGLTQVNLSRRRADAAEFLHRLAGVEVTQIGIHEDARFSGRYSSIAIPYTVWQTMLRLGELQAQRRHSPITRGLYQDLRRLIAINLPSGLADCGS